MQGIQGCVEGPSELLGPRWSWELGLSGAHALKGQLGFLGWEGLASFPFGTHTSTPWQFTALTG